MKGRTGSVHVGGGGGGGGGGGESTFSNSVVFSLDVLWCF